MRDVVVTALFGGRAHDSRSSGPTEQALTPVLPLGEDDAAICGDGTDEGLLWCIARLSSTGARVRFGVGVLLKALLLLPDVRQVTGFAQVGTLPATQYTGGDGQDTGLFRLHQ